MSPGKKSSRNHGDQVSLKNKEARYMFRVNDNNP